ncbi:MAG: winged helix-turn-helix transcriptional regulator [Candidatus Aminicenantes bacterium]|nr:winged helix-turn-helix transcriptional regulator [Candidatus Aminicenantes bacterium]
MKYKYKEESEFMKAISHPMRLQILEILHLGLPTKSCNVNAIQKILGIPQSTISQHLQALKSKGIIEGDKTGVEICYKVVDMRVVEIMKIFKK